MLWDRGSGGGGGRGYPLHTPCESLGWDINSPLRLGNIFTPRDFESTENGTGQKNYVACFSKILGF